MEKQTQWWLNVTTAWMILACASHLLQSSHPTPPSTPKKSNNCKGENSNLKDRFIRSSALRSPLNRWQSRESGWNSLEHGGDHGINHLWDNWGCHWWSSVGIQNRTMFFNHSKSSFLLNLATTQFRFVKTFDFVLTSFTLRGHPK